MNIKLNFYALAASVVLAGAATLSCNKDNEIEGIAEKPQIILDNTDGIYSVKTGHELTIAPEFKNADNASITWTLNGDIVCRTTSWTAIWPEEGKFYVTISATNNAGSASEEIRVDVAPATPPIISLRIPDGGLKIKAETDYILEPTIQHSDLEGFSIVWYVNGDEASHDMSYTFNRSATGIYHIRIVAVNIDGTTEKEFDIEVVDSLPGGVTFTTPTYLQTSTNRYTFAGRPVFLRPILTDIDSPSFSWAIDNKPIDCTENVLKFTPDTPGEYTVKVTVNESQSAEIKVICVSASENGRFRAANASSSPFADKVYEWIPAPGQFINETSSIGGMTGAENTIATANSWAKQRLDSKQFVSLGSFGGYIVVGFDHSVPASSSVYDLAIGGNAFLSTNGASNEPGIVWVMQDVNGNGLPDDEWYELKGCESDNPATLHNYSVTYFRPEAPKMDVEWIDSEGKTGKIRHLDKIHPQDYYYPAWIQSDSYTLYGTRIPSNHSENPDTGYWTNNPYSWGYVDNIGSDNILTTSTSSDGTGQRTGFKLANAVYADGTLISLKYIDFVKVQVAVLANSGPLGEVSTEVSTFQDYSME
ncbi:MAG: cell surface protein [Muribaculum sp.]|nr:cell surface protein [Muribaculum sp.]